METSMTTTRRHYLYRITNLVNGKIYIGQTLDPKNRWESHILAANTNKPIQLISKKIKQYGKDNFTFDIIASIILPCSCQPELKIRGTCQDYANELEIFLIQQYSSFVKNGAGYNKNRGGGEYPKNPGASLKGRHLSPQTEFKKGHKPPIKTLQKIAITKENKFSWPEDQELVKLINENGFDYVSTLLKCSNATVRNRLDKKGLKFNTPRTAKLSKINWPDDQVLIEKANKYGLTFLSKELDCGINIISQRLRQKGLKFIPQPIKNTFESGSNHKMSKLKEDQVLEIVRLHNSGRSQSEIAKQFNITRAGIALITRGERWSHLTGIIYTPKSKTPKQ